MSKISRADSKARFRTGMYPTQADFENLHDSYVHKDDTIPLEQVGTNGATVVSLLNQKANSSHTHEIADVNGLQAFITKVNTFLGTVDASDDTINRWKEIEAFLTGITDTETLTGLLQDLKAEIEGNIAVDSELSATSEHALQNKVLYDELRITETGSGSVLSVNGTNYPIVELDATDFDVINYTGSGDTDWEFKKIPVLDSNKAYIIKNANFSESNNDYSFSNQGTFLVKFQPSDNLGEYASLLIGHNDTSNFYEEEETVFNKWLSIPATEQFNVTNWGTHSDNDTTIPYYGTSYEDGGSSTITELTNATETTGSASTVNVKSLKAKIAELEARLAAVPTNYLEFTFDMSAYASAEVGKVLLYLGATTQDFTHCYFYEKTASGWKNARVSPVIQ